MSSDVKCVTPVERVGVVHDLLSSCEHGCYPIVDERGVLFGTISRSVLCTLLKEKAFSKPSETGENFGPRRVSPLISWAKIESVYPRYPTVHDAQLNPEVRPRERSEWRQQAEGQEEWGVRQ